MTRWWRVAAARFRAVVRREASSLRQGSAALMFAVVATLLAGLMLGAITDTLEELPGLLLLVPAAVALRGNVGGTLANRLGTAMHAGTFRIVWRRDSIFGQNLGAALALSLVMSLVLALLAQGATVLFDLRPAISVADFVVVSVVGGVIASVVVLAATVMVTSASASRGWDLDNVAAPIVTATGDLVTIPSLWMAAHLAEVETVTGVTAGGLSVVAVVALVMAWRNPRVVVRHVVRQSLPVLAVAGAVSIVAGLAVEKQLETLAPLPALLVLIPPFLGVSGALGGIFSSRIATKLHLGLVEPGRFRILAVAEDLILVACFAGPVFMMIGFASNLLGAASGLAGPGVFDTVGATLLAGAFTTAGVILVGYLGTVTAFRLGLDPDNYAIPVVTSSLDLLGAFAIILSLAVVGVI